MTKIEKLFYGVVKQHLPTATKVEYDNERETLYIFFKAGDNEFGLEGAQTKSVRMLRIYGLMGDDKFDPFMSDVEDVHRVLTLDGDPLNMDVTFLFV
jgi:hypothetical protein